MPTLNVFRHYISLFCTWTIVANLYTFCSPVSPDHRTLGPVVKFENQQELLGAASLVDLVRQIFAELAGTGNFSFFTTIDFSCFLWNLYHRIRIEYCGNCPKNCLW
jgi:hypothetical protein